MIPFALVLLFTLLGALYLGYERMQRRGRERERLDAVMRRVDMRHATNRRVTTPERAPYDER